MQPYSKNYIDSVNIKNYLNENFIKTGLDSRIKNFKDASFMVDYDDMIGVRALDHYMCKIIMDNGPIDYNLRLYLYKIKVALEDNPFLFYSLPISKVDINQLRKYIPEIDEYVSLIKNKGNEVYNIYLKFDKNPDSLTMEEKSRLVEYFYYRVDTDDKGVRVCLDKFIRYLLNKGMRIGYQALSLIIKYFGYQKCIEDGLKDTEIIIADMSKYEKKYNKEVFGFSMGNNVVLSKKE